MTASSVSVISRMKVLPWRAGSTATWRFSVGGADEVDRATAVPLVVVPGGPGMAHGYLSGLAGLARPNRPVVFYDPLGCGQSASHDDDARPDFATLVDEFSMVVDHVGGAEGCSVLGHSSGGWIALEAILADLPTRSRVANLVLASVPLDVPAFAKAQHELIGSLGVRAHRLLRKTPPKKGRRARAYGRHYERFLRAFICRAPWPAELIEAMGQSNREMYEALWGPSEVHVTGELRDWSCVDRVGVLDMPILLTSGRHDEVAPELIEQASDVLPRSQARLFENSAHMPHLEEPELYLEAVDVFLQQGPAHARE